MTFLLSLILLPLTLVTLFFAIEVVAGLRRTDPLAASPVALPNTTIIVPAHNEAAVIGSTICELQKQLPKGAHLLVVADNCTDDTVEVARSSGAEVIERQDPSRRGKGYALDFGRAHLRKAPPDVVLVLDADCTIDESSAQSLIAACAATQLPCQATYLFLPEPDGSPIVQFSTFAFCLKNLVRQRGLQRLAGQVRLTGTGMGFPWLVFDHAPLASGSIVEDLELGINLAEDGAPPRLVEHARVWSPAAREEATLSQRKRWEGGFLATMRTAAPRALSKASKRRDIRALCAALDLCVPPLTLLFLINAAGIAAGAAVIALTAANWWPLIALASVTALAGASVLLAWYREGRDFVGGRALAGAPLYLAWKFSLYLGLVREGVPKEWQRTDRHQ